MILSLMLFSLIFVPLTVPLASQDNVNTRSKNTRSISSTIGADSELVSWVGRYNYSETDQTTWISYSLSGFVVNANCTTFSIKATAKTADDSIWVPTLAVIVDENYNDIHYVNITSYNSEYGDYVLADDLELKEHSFRVLKRSEAGYSIIGIKDIVSDGTFQKSVDNKEKSILFIGDHLGLGDYTEEYNGERLPLSTYTTNPFNSYWFTAAQALNANYMFVGARAFPVYKTTTLDPRFKLNNLKQLFDSSNFYIDTNKNNFVPWEADRYTPDIVVLNVGFPDHSMYSSMQNEDKPYFIRSFRNSLSDLVTYIIEKYPDSKLVFMDGMVYTEQKISDVINEVCESFEGKTFRLKSKSRTLKEEMFYNMPTLNMQKYAGNELAELITNIFEGKTKSKVDIYKIVSVFAVFFIGLLIPGCYLILDKKLRGRKA